MRAAGPKVSFDIPAGNFPQTMGEFYRQSQVQPLYVQAADVTGIQTHAVRGEFEASEALRVMLEGTGLTFEFENEYSVLVRPAAPGSAEVEKSGASQTVGAHAQRLTIAGGADEDAIKLPEVLVTGSYIHGLKDMTSPLVVFGEREKRQASYGTVQDVLRTLPMNFGGGPSEDYSKNSNFGSGWGIDIRGIGTGATLVLVDGYRQPVSGLDGNFVDVSTIPWSAVERIEILPDGASALYGSDAIAGVVNIIMRKDLSGGESQVRLGASPQGADETLASQLFGHHWDSGSWLFDYQYSRRTKLLASDRAYAADADKRPFGGTDQRTISSSPGNILDPVTQLPAFAIPSGQNGRSLTPAELLPGVVNRTNQLQGYELLPDRENHSAYFTVSQNIGERFELFAGGRYNHRETALTGQPYNQSFPVPAKNPFFVDPFGGSSFVLVAYNFVNEFGPFRSIGETETYTGTLGLKAKFADRWQATLSEFYGREDMRWTGYNWVDFMALNRALNDTNPNTAFNPFGSSANANNPETLAAIRLIQRENAVSDVTTTRLVVDGALPDLPTGTPRLAMGFDSYRENISRQEGRNNHFTDTAFSRRTNSAFVELSLPLLRRLELSLAARYQDYSDFGMTFNPKLGLRWAATESLRFRGSWGSSFRAPTLVDLHDKSQDRVYLIPIADRLSPARESNVLALIGSNPSLHQETATNLTAGVDFAPAGIPGFTLSSTYYRIDYEGQAWFPDGTLTPEALLNEPQWAPLVTRNPSQSEINAICGSSAFFGSPSDCVAHPPTAILDGRIRNLSTTIVKGVDLELKQALRTDYGSLSFGLNSSYLFSYERAVTQTASPVDLAGLAGDPPKLRFRGTADWYRHGRSQPGFGMSLAADYLSAFRDYEHPPVAHIRSLTTFDLQLSYRTEASDRWLGNLELILNTVNLFNRNPPFVNNIFGYDGANTKPYGRVISFGIQKNWGR